MSRPELEPAMSLAHPQPSEVGQHDRHSTRLRPKMLVADSESCPATTQIMESETVGIRLSETKPGFVGPDRGALDQAARWGTVGPYTSKLRYFPTQVTSLRCLGLQSRRIISALAAEANVSGGHPTATGTDTPPPPTYIHVSWRKVGRALAVIRASALGTLRDTTAARSAAAGSTAPRRRREA